MGTTSQSARRLAQIGAAVAVVALGGAALAGPSQADAPSPADTARVTITPSPRVASLIAQMTLDEKLSFVSPGRDPKGPRVPGYVPGVPRLGIPELRLTDGPAGIRNNTPTTALPTPTLLASSFDDSLARQYGAVLGRQARAVDDDVVFGPMVNTIRVPQAGRNFETFSEDPLVTSRTAAAEVKGIQGQGSIATVKHFAENNQETNRANVDVRVDNQTLHEVEVPGFAAAVKAGAGAVMCAYNSVNGAFSCGNSTLLNTVLKTQLKFQGWVVSDFGATHAATDLVAGLDMDMYYLDFNPKPYFTTDLRAALDNGTIPISALDDAVARIVGQMERVGLLDGAATNRPTLDLKAGAKVAQRIAESGAVLLKNAAGTLPLTSQVRSLALIGPSATTPKIGGGGSANVVPASAKSPLQTITARAGSGTDVTFSPGIPTTGQPIPADALSPAAPFADDGSFTVTPQAAVNYSGTLTVPDSGSYSFVVDAGTGYAALRIDGQSVATSILTSSTGTVQLSAGQHSFALSTFAASGVSTPMRLTWITPRAAVEARNQAVAVARTVDVPVVFAYDDGTEAADRASLSLPANQDALISAVADANPRTVVVLNAGSSVTMPWIGKVKSVLDTYYPGERGAEATARLLYGDVNPSGRLTQTFPASEDQTPVAGDPRQFPGVDNVELYSEGLDVGYKWWDRTGATPLFPFGHGLSYTTFSYGRPSVSSRAGGLDVQLALTNTGTVAGAEVPQVYVGPSPDLTLPQVVRKLVGYTKVTLQPGQTKTVSIRVPGDQLSSWDTASQSWVLGTGQRTVWIGPSSGRLPLQRTADVTKR